MASRFAKAAIASALLGMMSVAGQTASAQTALNFASTPNPGATVAYVAADQKMFEAEGLKVDMQFVGLDSNLPAAVTSGSVDFVSMSPTAFLRALDGGLDVVAICDSADINKDVQDFGIAVQPGIEKPADLEGKSVGVPGIGSILDVLAKAWLGEQKVAVEKVHFVEAQFPVHMDLMKAKKIDAIVSVDPFLGNMLQIGTAKYLVYLNKAFPAGKPVNLMVTTRSWASAHPKEVAAIRSAVQRAADFGNSHPEELRRILGTMLKRPPEAMKAVALPLLAADLPADKIAWWIDLMKSQKLLDTDVTPQKAMLQ